MRILFILILLIFSFKASGNDFSDWRKIVLYPRIDSESLNSLKSALPVEEQLLLDQATALSEDIKRKIVNKTEHGYILRVDCRLNYWVWSGNTWIEKLDHDSVGDYCGAQLIFNDSSILSLGGYGFWQNNFDLVLLNDPSGKPQFVTTQNQPKFYYSSLISQMDTGVLVLFGTMHNERVSSNRIPQQGKFLDFNSLTWKDISIDFMDKKWEGLFSEKYFSAILKFDLKDYTVFYYGKSGSSQLGILILNKRTLELSEIGVPIIDLDSFSSYLVTDQNQIRFTKKDGSGHFYFDLEEYLPEAQLIGKITINKYPNSVYQTGAKWLLAGLALLLIGFAGWKIRTSMESDSDQPEELNSKSPASESDFLAFFPYRGQTLDQSKMDELLGLGPMSSFEFRKVQRAKKIRTFNSIHDSLYGTPLIIRERDPKDKRMINYRIVQISDTERLLSSQGALLINR